MPGSPPSVQVVAGEMTTAVENVAPTRPSQPASTSEHTARVPPPDQPAKPTAQPSRAPPPPPPARTPTGPRSDPGTTVTGKVTSAGWMSGRRFGRLSQ